MKYFVLIFIFCFSKLFAQLNPPDLRCLEILANGNVKLTWIPVDDPASQFTSYEIFFSTSRLGPFNSLNANISPVTTSTFVHTGTTSIAQSCFYYMVTKSNGGNTSVTSATLQTIHLNPIPTNVSLNVTFTHLRTPKLPTSYPNYDVLKEYPIGTWNTLAATSNSVYPDTITTCGYLLSYQATLTDNSGCVSISNIVSGKYNNTKEPEQPQVDSISVLPNGNTVLSWQPPIDMDVNKYEIQYRTGGTNQKIDSTMNRLNTFYTYTTTTANSGNVGIYTKAIDSCGNGSTVDYRISTLFIRTTYDECAHKTVLRWNKYFWSPNNPNPSKQLGEYRIYYSVDGGAYQRVGATKDTNFIHTGVDPGKNVCYFVRVVNERRNITASSNRYCFFTAQVPAPLFAYIKTASVLNETSAEINVFLDTTARAQGLYIDRSEDNVEFKNIGFVPFHGGENYSFKDDNIESTVRSYYYKAIVVDDCGNRRESSRASKTILLKVRGDEEQLFTKQLSWNAYEGFGGVISGYNVFRYVDEGSETLIGTTDPLTTTYTDNLEEAAPLGAKVQYKVQAIEGIGVPSGFFEKSYSNPASVYMEGRLFVPNAFAPDGVNKTWRPVSYFIGNTEYHVSVFNRWGKLVFETGDNTQAWDGSNCIAGVYVYLIDYKNSRGEYSQLKGTVQLLR